MWVICFFPAAQAGCLDQVTGESGNNFSTAVMCTNTLSQPSYQFSFYENADIFYGMFSFDKRNAGWLCVTHGNIEGDNLKCQKSGLRNVQAAYQNGNSRVEMIDLDHRDATDRMAAILDSDLDFSTAGRSADITEVGCLAAVNNSAIYLAYSASNIYSLSNCLFAFEKFLSKNPRLALKLR
ncbi:hypothetical protein IDSA_08890 [Pseudidiomarina salinarum]|uniref:Uncharacterized protein n=2 Tax=Pseudidiomarina salinarum TaxID=435908 RepID=A0A094L789_9GAMM|nr:hypothetical protein IDSA_08890 [Pseudidiomarina salinarum]RUO69149.1 hypothetical protein CWI79_09580 [Pseudidiomarina salinarum]